MEVIKGAYRETIEEIPLVAFREAIANAIVHREYMLEADVRVEIFDDRVEILSPGGLPIGITEEEYIDGRVSIPRNRIISDVFLRLGIIERLATGIRRIREYYKNSGANPEF
ncbi:MAG: ATP-binding protein [Sedimentibacter sp.]